MSSFKEAFAAARKAGKKEFKWNGKSYHTKLKEEVTTRPQRRPAAPAVSARPKARTNDAGKPSVSETPTRGPDPKPDPQIVRGGSKPTSPKATPAAKPAKQSSTSTRSGPMNNPVSRGASGLGKRVGEFFNGRSKRKPVKLDPKANKHPYD